jgi:hypothetical protein
MAKHILQGGNLWIDGGQCLFPLPDGGDGDKSSQILAGGTFRMDRKIGGFRPLMEVPIGMLK